MGIAGGYEGTQKAITWEITKAGDITTAVLAGEIDESAPFSRLRDELVGEVIMDLENVRRINSAGVREWVNLVSDLESAGVTKLTFVRCSPGIVTQLNMIYNFCGPGRVESFIAPFVCDNCGAEELKVLEAATLPEGPASKLPTFSCPNCQQTMEFDELPDYYLSFLGA
jgi:anti-anti-sigma regulatory factor